MNGVTQLAAATALIVVQASHADAVFAQDADAGAAAPAAVAGFQDGFFIQTPAAETRLVVGLVAQTDGRFTAGSGSSGDTFTIRRLRPTFSGRIASYVEFRVVPDFGGGASVIQDAYVDLRLTPRLRIRMGKDKTPIGYELLIPDAYLFFPERALASGLVPNRDIGVQVQGEGAGGRVIYAVGLFNGIPDGASSTADVDANNAKDVAGRVVLKPFARDAAGALRGLGVQLGGSSGRQAGPLPTFRTSVGQTYFAYASSATADGTRQRISPALFYYYKAFGGFAEYMRSAQRISNGGARRNFANEAWEVTASYFLTGDTASDRFARPRNGLEHSTGRWGAVQVLGRYSQLLVDRSAFSSGLAAPGASRQARSVAIAVNWYPAAYIKYYTAFERTVFDGGSAGSRPPEHAVVLRAQLAF